MAPADGIGAKIRGARESRHLRQEDLAELIGVSRSAVNAWENDRAYPRGKYRRKIEDALRVSLRAEAATEPHPGYDDPVLQDLWERLQPLDLTPETRRTLVDYAHFLRTREAERRRREGA